jgi:hypothetical protein
MPPFVPEDRQYRGFTYQSGEAAFEEGVESRAIGSGTYNYKGVTLTASGRNGRLADGKLELVYEYVGKRPGDTVWVSESGRTFAPSSTFFNALKPANWMPESHGGSWPAKQPEDEAESGRRCRGAIQKDARPN